MSRSIRQFMRRQPRWQYLGILPIVTGLVWIICGWRHGIIAGIPASVPGVILAGTGAALLLWPGDRHINYNLTLCALVSAGLAIPFAWPLGVMTAVFLFVASAVCVVLGGYMALLQDAVPAEIPVPPITLRLAFKAALDELVLAGFVAQADIPRGPAALRDEVRLTRLQAMLARHDWSRNPDVLHATPHAPENTRVSTIQRRDLTYEWLAFDSEYVPAVAVPGTARWQGKRANQRMYARVFRHGDQPRPWLMCLHGYQMGTPAADFSLFDIHRLHDTLGLNLIMPILPLHGPRRDGFFSGGQFLDGPMADLWHAQAQCLWDMRRCLAWVHERQPDAAIGVLGYSLGGYNAALLAAFEPALTCVIAGIPLTDIPAVLWRHMPLIDQRYIESCGVTQEWISRILAPVSPLHLPCRVPRERRFILAGTGDQLVPPAQPLALWRHWEEPTMHWYQGTHMSIRRERSVADFVDQALHASQLVVPEHAPAPG